VVQFQIKCSVLDPDQSVRFPYSIRCWPLVLCPSVARFSKKTLVPFDESKAFSKVPPSVGGN